MEDEIKSGWLNKRWVQVMLHIAVWVIVFALPFLLNRYSDGGRMRDHDSTGFMYLINFTGLLWIVLFYVNAYLLVPELIYTKRYALYALFITGIFFFFMLIHTWLFHHFVTGRHMILSRAVGFNLPPFMLSLAVSTTYRMVIDKGKTDKLLLQKQEENLKSELLFLRSQVSPHFMFNILNNMLALARMKSDQLEPTIFKLSTLMRYMLYETNEEKVSLQKEMDYLNSYIDLQKQRVGGKVKLDSNILMADQSHEIAPMLLIPFIENAFKHGTANVRDAQIDINIFVQGNELNFVVRNRFDANGYSYSKDKTPGIGLMNVIRRLNLLYPDKHHLLISKEEGWFVVSLQINLV